MPLININFNVARTAASPLFTAAAVLLLLLPVSSGAWAAYYQADLMVKLASEQNSSYVGSGLFETEPAVQFKFQAVPTARGASYRIVVKNAGDSSDRFLLQGTGSGAGFTVRYLDAQGGELNQFGAGGYRTEALQPGETLLVQVEVTPSDLPLGVTYQVTVAAASLSDATRVDRVALQTITCGTTAAVTLSTPPDATGSPGDAISYPYTVTNVGNGSNSFTLSATSSSGRPVLLFADDGAGGGSAGDGVRQPGESRGTSSTGVLGPGESYRFFVVVSIPGGSGNGSMEETTLSAAGTGASASDQVATTTVAPVLTVAENVRNLTQGGGYGTETNARPGETLEYRMALTNSGQAPATALVLKTPVPESTTLLPDSLKVSTSASGEAEPCPAQNCGQASESQGEISAYLGEGALPGSGGRLSPGRTLYVYFRVLLK